MLRDAAVLLSHKVVFSDEAKTTEVKKRKLTYDIRTVLGSKKELDRVRKELQPERKKDKKKQEHKAEREAI